VYEALHCADTKSTDKVGIVGFGGLGHLAVMFARAMGCEVVVFSGSEAKKADAMAMGATEFCVLPPKNGAAPTLKGGVNVLLLCGGTLPDFGLSVFQSQFEGLLTGARLIPLLARRAAIVPLIIQGEPLVIP